MSVISWLLSKLPQSKPRPEPIYLAETAHKLLIRLVDGPLDLQEPAGRPGPMQQRFIAAGFVSRTDTLAAVSSGTGVFGRYTITDNGLRVLDEAQVVSDTDPRAVGLE